MQNIKKLTSKIFSYKITPLIIFIIMALLMVSRQIWTHTLFFGADSLFHFNRFYDTAMQLKSGHFSYFQTNYGFMQSGRILSALYGPIIAYLGGAILLLCGTWFKFQIVLNLLVLVTAGLTMYRLNIHNHVSRGYAMIIAVIYMYSSQIVQWVTSQQFTAFGAALLPLLILSGTRALREHDVSVIGLALSMSLLIQTHLMSSMIGAIGILPLFIVGLVTATDKWKLVRHTLYAAGLTILLTINIWYNLIVISAQNKLLSVYPVHYLRTYGFNFDLYSITNIFKPTEVILFLFVIGFVIYRWKKLELITKTLTVTGLGFMIVSSSHFPWGLLQRFIPSLTYTLQFPKRFLVLPFIMILLALGMIMTFESQTNQAFFQKEKWWRLIMVVVIIFGSLGLDFYSMNERIYRYDRTAEGHNESNYHDSSLYYYFGKHHRNVRSDIDSPHLGHLINDYLKASPDYLPVKQSIKGFNEYNAFNPYDLDYHQYIGKNQVTHFKHRVWPNGSLSVAWHSPQQKWTQVPLVKYANTKVTLNGNVLKKVHTTNLGAIVVHAKAGHNRVTIKYQTSFMTRLMMVICMLSWLALLFYFIISKIVTKI
ncbi:YfhO family protein [Apilactobacillus apisilvae]|uniref:YfhO family protein n=1 Tax=Apilactobacillus apisilvae TaxID=2923364 RepID=A0ABY4PHL1_9LACO|nr:YfhO family protein [Apilactobacillus apisilvae]UQS84951.1 YfhO family protein [Apilactobacillus apisilvae]